MLFISFVQKIFSLSKIDVMIDLRSTNHAKQFTAGYVQMAFCDLKHFDSFVLFVTV